MKPIARYKRNKAYKVGHLTVVVSAAEAGGWVTFVSNGNRVVLEDKWFPGDKEYAAKRRAAALAKRMRP